MSTGRATDMVQVDMFNLIEGKLLEQNLHKYEISNFSEPKYESVHNTIYWTDQAYWGIGLSAHSYFPHKNLRFWNPKSIGEYQKLMVKTENNITDLSNINHHLSQSHYEFLKPNEVITDFCHTHLRMLKGIPKEALRNRFNSKQNNIINSRLLDLTDQGLIQQSDSFWSLSKKGLLVSNLVFKKVYFSPADLQQDPT